MKTTKHLKRRIVSGFLAQLSYVVSGNHVFTLRDYLAIESGAMRLSVLENPTRHSPAVVRAASLLSLTY